MDKENIQRLIDASKAKAALVNSSRTRYFLLSMLAGIYVGFGIILIFSIGAPLKAAGAPGLKALMGASFSIALTLVVFAGSELFTGNNMTMMIGSLARQVSWLDTFKVWTVSYFGNLAGSLLLAVTMAGTGLIAKSPLKDFILAVSAGKMSTPFWELFLRGVLANMLVCLAIWTASRAKEDTAKLILIFWSLFGFIGAGFEHSVANMTLLGMALFISGTPSSVSWGGFAANLIPVSLGNLIGGAVFIGAAYWYISKEKS